MCDLANRLTDDSEVPMVRSEAFRQAHLVRRLLERLGQGAVTFRYRKADGSLRRARGTLARGIDPEFDAYVGDGKRRDTDTLNFTYWDLQKHAFRSFSAGSVVTIEEGGSAL